MQFHMPWPFRCPLANTRGWHERWWRAIGWLNSSQVADQPSEVRRCEQSGLGMPHKSWSSLSPRLASAPFFCQKGCSTPIFLLILDAMNDIMAAWPPSTHLPFCQEDCHKVFGNSLVVPESRIWTVSWLQPLSASRYDIAAVGFDPGNLLQEAHFITFIPILTAGLSNWAESEINLNYCPVIALSGWMVETGQTFFSIFIPTCSFSSRWW